MSFDLKISNGDLSISSTGDFAIVTDTPKLEQDVLKIVSTPLNGNPFFPGYGSVLSKSSIGDIIDFQFTSSFITSNITNALQILQTYQSLQLSSGQKVTAAELLAAVKSVQVYENPDDPRYYQVSINILSKALTVVSPTFTLGPN